MPAIDANGDGPTTSDSGPVFDADPLCAGATIPFEPSNFTRCDLKEPTTAITLVGGDNAVIDTDNGTIEIGGAVQALSFSFVSQPNGPELMVVSTSTVNVPDAASLRFKGTHPIAIASLGNIDIGGQVDIGGAGTAGAPGANSSSCGLGSNGVAQTGAGTSQPAASGGGGGGYGGAGGTGAAVPDSGPSTSGGEANGNPEITPLRGGCNGGAGGNANSGQGGGGGGALQLVASEMILVRSGASVSAFGAGGVRADSYAAGGGGGSGGALLFEAPMIQIDGAVTANGGGGGQGNRGGNSGDSEDGEDGHPDDEVPAAGGDSSQSPSGGNGGNGGTAGAAASAGLEGTNDGTRSAGGGGGGGSVGRIRLNVDATPSLGGLVSPAPG